MSIVNVNQPNFFGNDGLPLKSGYIWIGEPNKSPIDFPLTVTFTDSLGNSFPATQPLRTNNQGKIQWNGKAIIASVDSNYSMLIQDSTQTDINNGYIPEIDATNAGGSGDLNDYRQYGLLLADIKGLEVIPGMTVGTVGKLSVTDTEGADWLVVSPTGSPADDIDIIDFDNGLQGTRIVNSGAAVAGFNKSAIHYQSDGVLGPPFSVAATLPVSTFQTIGPTGSGATNIWTALDSLPPTAKYIEFAYELSASAVGITSTLGVTLSIATTAGGSYPLATRITADTGTFTEARGMAKVQLDDDNVFRASWSESNSVSRIARLSFITGFGV